MEYLGEIGQHIFSRLTDRELAALIVTSSDLAVLIDSQSHLFWYERARSLLSKLDLQKREGSDWRLIYSYLSSPNRKDYSRGAFHLDTMKILLEAYPTNTMSTTDISEIRNAEVLEYILDYSEMGVEPIARTIVELTMKDYPTQAVLMVDVLDERRISVGEAAARTALFYGHVGAFKNLTRNRLYLLDTLKNFRAAIEGENIDSLLYMKSTTTKHELSMYENVLINYARTGTSVGQDPYPVSFRFLLQDKVVDRGQLSRFYEQTAHHPSSGILQVLVDKGLHLPTDEWKRLAILAIESEDADLLSVTLKQWNPTVFWELLGYLLTKQPTSLQLLGYIRDNLLKKREVREALAAVFNETALYDEDVAPIRGLLLFLIYPNITVQESTNYLRELDRYSEDVIKRTNLLLSLIRRE